MSYTRSIQLNSTIPDITIFVPLGVARDLDFVELGNVAVMLCMFTYISCVLIMATRRITWQGRIEKIK